MITIERSQWGGVVPVYILFLFSNNDIPIEFNERVVRLYVDTYV